MMNDQPQSKCYPGFADIENASKEMGRKYKDRPCKLISSMIDGYQVRRAASFTFSLFTLIINEDFVDAILKVNGEQKRVELVYLLFQVTLHVLKTAMPSRKISHDLLYSGLLDMTESIESDSDLIAILVQFVCGFQTDEAIRSHAAMLEDAWSNNHHPAALLEMISLLGCLHAAPGTTQQLTPLETIKNSCGNVLKDLEMFHKTSVKLVGYFTKSHLKKRKQRGSPAFFYKCQLGRIAQIWLTHPPLVDSIYVGSGLPFKHWDALSHESMEGLTHLPPGLPRCLLANPNVSTDTNSRLQLSIMYRNTIISYIDTIEELRAELSHNHPWPHPTSIGIRECELVSTHSQQLLELLNAKVEWQTEHLGFSQESNPTSAMVTFRESYGIPNSQQY